MDPDQRYNFGIYYGEFALLQRELAAAYNARFKANRNDPALPQIDDLLQRLSRREVQIKTGANYATQVLDGGSVVISGGPGDGAAAEAGSASGRGEPDG